MSQQAQAGRHPLDLLMGDLDDFLWELIERAGKLRSSEDIRSAEIVINEIERQMREFLQGRVLVLPQTSP